MGAGATFGLTKSAEPTVAVATEVGVGVSVDTGVAEGSRVAVAVGRGVSLGTGVWVGGKAVEVAVGGGEVGVGLGGTGVAVAVGWVASTFSETASNQTLSFPWDWGLLALTKTVTVLLCATAETLN